VRQRKNLIMADVIIKGKSVLIDDDDLWIIGGSTQSWITNYGYAMVLMYPPVGFYIPVGKTINHYIKKMLLHRVIMFNKLKYGYEVDHINHNRLDNRKSNLRIVTHSENMLNALPPRKQDGTSSVFKGVSKRGDKWQVIIRFGDKLKHFGVFDTEEQAGIIASQQFDLKQKLKLTKELV
jgi:hypothetical protein